MEDIKGLSVRTICLLSRVFPPGSFGLRSAEEFRGPGGRWMNSALVWISQHSLRNSTHHHPHPSSLQHRFSPAFTSTMARIHCANAQSTVASFIQLAQRSYSTKAAQASAPLEFLVPRCTPPFGLRAPQLYVTHSRAYAHPRRSLGSRSHEISTRQFSTSAVRQKTQAILNPQQDEDGNEMLLEITDRAAKVFRPDYCTSGHY